MSSLVDINVWLGLTFTAHQHHAAAVGWFGQCDESSAAFCRMTQQGFLRLASNSLVFKSDALNLRGSWAKYDTLLSDERVCFQHEPLDVEDRWRQFTMNRTFSAKIWNDAYLAAFAISSGLELVTFDKGFRRYEGLDLKLLE